MAKDEKQQKQEQQPMSFSDYITVLRNQIVLSYDGAKEIALKNFDDITKRLIEQIQANQEQAKTTENPPLVTPNKEKPNPRK